MKNLKNILYLFMVAAVVTSCNRDVADINFNNIPNTLYFASANGTLLVEDGASNMFNVPVSATAVASSDTPYTMSIDASSTAVEGVDFEITTTNTVLPTGDIVTSYGIVADFDNAATEGKTVVFNLTSDASQVADSDQYTLSLIKLCPINAPFTGTYTLSTVSNGIFDSSTFGDGVYEVSVGATPTDRVFTAQVYPGLGSFGDIEFKFSLICGNVVVPTLQETGVGCGGSTTLGPAATFGQFDGDDDTVIQVIYIDDEASQCVDAVTAEFTLTKM
ncbi:hypothetical protein [Olleya sp. 1-3]|uniref:hypothetical protein n=1 Tax=Olleya sp. 1-3 TaxID=2058323 RepID=UPI000C333C28|nr:hypothetical protein [Olleya sp. 1-3]PKG51155.1 hypothetical protein CXF54_09605 [Olleya sp. 1-3]